MYFRLENVYYIFFFSFLFVFSSIRFIFGWFALPNIAFLLPPFLWVLCAVHNACIVYGHVGFGGILYIEHMLSGSICLNVWNVDECINSRYNIKFRTACRYIHIPLTIYAHFRNCATRFTSFVACVCAFTVQSSVCSKRNNSFSATYILYEFLLCTLPPLCYWIVLAAQLFEMF